MNESICGDESVPISRICGHEQPLALSEHPVSRICGHEHNFSQSVQRVQPISRICGHDLTPKVLGAVNTLSAASAAMNGIPRNPSVSHLLSAASAAMNY